VKRRDAPNPQVRFGADVVSRIAREAEVADAGLHELLQSTAREWGIGLGRPVVAVGNTVMAHFLMGRSPAGLGAHPYRSALPRRTVLSGVRLVGRGRLRIRMLPLLGRFVGSDCCAAILAAGMHRRDGLSLLVDAGTNGEVALGNRERILVCSTAAGPAFEGATLECGSLARKGAVKAVRVERGRMRVETFGQGRPTSICGSGVLDAVAAGLRLGLLEPNGRIAGGAARFTVADRVYLSQGDVRAVQLAVGAIGAGIRLLLRSWGAGTGDVGQVFLTGRFGAAIDPESAAATGLLPATGAPVRQHGNLALRGAVMAAGDSALMEEALGLARVCREVMLSGRPDFEQAFVEAMELRPWH
jgi:uncharacterized 2Fe-2S/4Fe-4S cluster protein (DUF4445 family)